jgi:hypothetical protein
VSGNITGPGIERTIGARARFSEAGGTVVRARHRGEPGRVPLICRRFEREDFEPLWLSEPDAGHGVRAHPFAGTPRRPRPGLRMPEFVGYDVLRDRPDAAAS